jgi:hypothetical protein
MAHDLVTPFPDDDENTTRAINSLNEAGIRFQRKTRYHFKFGSINYFPKTGTTHIDGEDKARPGRGLREFINLIETTQVRRDIFAKRVDTANDSSTTDSINVGSPAKTNGNSPSPREYLTLTERNLQLRPCVPKERWLATHSGPLIDFVPTPQTQAHENEIEELNQFLGRCDIKGCSWGRFHRIFNEGNDPKFNWNKGGRLYSHGTENYQQQPKENRLRMTINKEPVCEVDIAASYLTIFHGWHNLTFDPTGDPYQLHGLHSQARKVVKDWFIVTFGSDGHFTSWPAKIQNEYYRAGIDLEKLYAVKPIRRKAINNYPILAQWDAPEAPRWADLMYRESNAIVGTMLELMREHKIASLPVHDSLIIPQSQRHLAETVLKRHFQFSCHAEPKLVVHLPESELTQG